SVLEIGVGTGFGLAGYPSGCRVTAIDLSARMIARASARCRRQHLTHVKLSRMDATHLGFSDGSFDAVYAPYVVHVVAEPQRVGREIARVCRPGGRIVLLNHFETDEETSSAVNRAIGHIATTLTGVDWHLGLHEFLNETGLAPISIEAVN